MPLSHSKQVACDNVAPRLVSRRPVCGNGDVAPVIAMRRTAPVSAPKTKSFRREPGATGQNSCQPEGLGPESAMAALLVLAIERLLPSPGALPSPILAATHTCFMALGTPNSAFEVFRELSDRRVIEEIGHFELARVDCFDALVNLCQS